ncbi:hypothetical protein BHM03_00053611, partial [Ensete ventricosum]
HEDGKVVELANEVRKVLARLKEKKIAASHASIKPHLSHMQLSPLPETTVLVLTKECNSHLYRSVQAVHTGPPSYRYMDRPLPGSTTKIDRRRWSISAVGRRLREKLTVGGRLREKKKEEGEKKKEEEEEKKKEVPPFPVPSSPTGDFSHGQFFSRARR